MGAMQAVSWGEMVKRGVAQRLQLALRIPQAQAGLGAGGANAGDGHAAVGARLLHGAALRCRGGKNQLVVVAAGEGALLPQIRVKTGASARK